MSLLKYIKMKSKYTDIGACGLSCRVCPGYILETKNKCHGCKTEWRLRGPCSVIHCVVKRDIEFCGDCEEGDGCKKWKYNRDYGKKQDSFKCYQTLEDDIAFIKKYGLDQFRKTQKIKAKLLKTMMDEFNEGRSKTYFCIAVTVLNAEDLKKAIDEARKSSRGLDIKGKAKVLHSILDDIASRENISLKLRKKKKEK